MKIRDLISRLLAGCGFIDDLVNVKIVRRGEGNVVTHVAIVPISYVDTHDNICVEESQIEWKPYL